MTDCTCPEVSDTVRAYLAGDPPPCDLHNPVAAPADQEPPALNSDRLTQSIAAALGISPI